MDFRAIAKRAAGRAMAEQGRDRHVHGASIARDVPAGIQVSVHRTGEPSRPGSAAPAPERGARRGLVTGDCLADVPDGGTLRVGRDALVTALAEEEAWRRGIRFQRGAAVGGGASLRVAVGSDHGGYALKREVLDWLRELGHRSVDLGTRDTNACDYPDFARAVALAVANGQADFGVCIDGAGIGSAMAANKVLGVLAANCWSTQAAANAREHNHANVLTLGAGMIAHGVAQDVLRTFLGTAAGGGRHARRVAKIRAIEARETNAGVAGA